MATNTKKQEIKKDDTQLLLACILRELETLNKNIKLMAKLTAVDHGIETE